MSQEAREVKDMGCRQGVVRKEIQRKEGRGRSQGAEWGQGRREGLLELRTAG